MTAQDLITLALTDLGVVSVGVTPNASELANGLTKLNGLLGSLSLEGTFIYTIVNTAWPLTAGTYQYTMGTGGAFNTARPVKFIEEACTITVSGISAGAGLEMVNIEGWTAIVDGSTTSKVPLKCYPDNNYPLRLIQFWPIPNSSTATAYLPHWAQLTQFSALSDTFDLPPGYFGAIYNLLVLWLAPGYPGAPLNALSGANAQQCKDAIKQLNTSNLIPASGIPTGGTNNPQGA